MQPRAEAPIVEQDGLVGSKPLIEAATADIPSTLLSYKVRDAFGANGDWNFSEVQHLLSHEILEEIRAVQRSELAQLNDSCTWALS